MSWLDTLSVVAPSAVLAVIALIVFRHAVGRYLRSMKEEQPPIPCPKCSYDLRGNLFFCPECGTELLWGQLPGGQEEYDTVVRHRERQLARMRAGSAR